MAWRWGCREETGRLLALLNTHQYQPLETSKRGDMRRPIAMLEAHLRTSGTVREEKKLAVPADGNSKSKR